MTDELIRDRTRHAARGELVNPPDVPGYTMGPLIGEGASARVWAGTDRLGNAVAIKVLRHPGLAAAAGREAGVLTRVRHDHLVVLHEDVILPEGGRALVFERVRGATVAAMVAMRAHLRAGEVATVLVPVAEALAALHASGAVHADVSPGNIRVDPSGRPVLMDVGAARVAGEDGEIVWGTEGFAAPEVRLGERPTSASDVWSLGAVAWFCLTGNVAPQVLTRLDLDTVTSHVGPVLGPVIAAAIDPDPAVRPSARELARAIFDAVPAEPVDVVDGVPDVATALTHRIRSAAAAETSVLQPAAGPAWRRALERMTAVRLTKRLAVGLGVAMICVVAVVGAFAVDGSGSVVVASAGAAVVPSVTASDTASGTASGTSSGAASTPTALDPVDARAALQSVADRRAAALVSGQVAALRTVAVEGSPAWESDKRILTELTTQGVALRDVSFTVAQVDVVTSERTRLVVRARVDVASHEVAGKDQTRTAPGHQGELLDFELSRSGETAAWMLRQVTLAPAT